MQFVVNKRFLKQFIDSQYVREDEESKCRKLSLAEILELASFLISMQNTKIQNNLFPSENNNFHTEKNINNTILNNNATNNFITTAINLDRDKEYKRIDRKINCKKFSLRIKTKLNFLKVEKQVFFNKKN